MASDASFIPLSHASVLSLPTSLRVISLNCWGLKYLATHRHARLVEIGRQLANADPVPSIVGLQECWTQEDYLAIRELTATILPHGKFYHSGIFGGGLAILSRWPIEESSMLRYPLNGRPAAFWRGDWYVGKGVACARIRIGPGSRDVLEVFCTHLHAPYEEETHDTYLCHRTAQAWEIAKLMRQAAERGHLVLGLGDFNMTPLSLAHRLIEAHSPVRDVWRVVHPDSALGSARSKIEMARGRPIPSADLCLLEHGATCDGVFNTWRWSEEEKKALLKKGRDRVVDPTQPDPKARRLDYVFFADNLSSAPNGKGHSWAVENVRVGMTSRHPTLKVSLSDHFSVEATLTRLEPAATSTSAFTPASMVRPLDLSIYDTILSMIRTYTLREQAQRRWRIAHFWFSVVVSIACFIAVWWSPRNFVAFILMFISTLNFGAGIIDGLLGFLFVGSEERALREFEWEINAARQVAADLQSATKEEEESVA